MERLKKSDKQKKSPTTYRQWIKRLGAGAFIFFFVKGLIWLAIIFGAAKIFS